jgi:ABC-type glycerol-3-phosphate transport system permease component
MNTLHQRRLVKRWGLFALMIVLVIVVDMPIISLILNSFRSTSEILSSRSFWPEAPTLENYAFVTQRTAFFQYLLNSLIMAGGGMALSIMAATLAGYVLSRFRTRFVNGYGTGLFMVQMFPILLALIPLFIFFRTLGLVNTYYSVIILYTVAQLPFATSMFRAFFDGIPNDLEEAAKIDGANRFQAFLLVVLPLAGPAIAAVAIFAFLFSYNEYLIASVFLRREELYTVPIGIQQFIQQFSTDWGSLMAAAVLAMLPTFVLFLFIQKYMMYGAIGSGVKG